MKKLHLRSSKLIIFSLLSLALILGVTTVTIINNTAHASNVFPGMYPALTHSGSESYQQQVNQGQQTWLLDPSQTALHMAEQLLYWDPTTTTTVLQSGGGVHDSSATVVVNSRAIDRGSVTVTLARLDGNTNGGIWIVTGAISPGRSITNPQPYATLPKTSSSVAGQTPYTVTGTGPDWEGIIGRVYLLNPSYTGIAVATAYGGNGNTSFSTPLTYSTSSTGDALVALYSYGAADGGINGAVLVKVTIG